MAQKHVVILGAGPGGYAAAFLAADKGMRVTLVDSGQKPGGVCLHRGCIPSKTLLHLAKLINETREAKNWGIAFTEPDIDIQRVRQWKNQVIDKLAGGLVMLCRQRGVNFISGQGSFQDCNTLRVAGKENIAFDQCVLAVGSRPVIPAMFADSGSLIMDSTSALEIEEIPRQLLIVGGGYIGLEMGTVYAALGSRVTVVEMTENLLPGLDRDLVRPLQLRLRRQFENIFLNTRVRAVKPEGTGVQVQLEGEGADQQHSFDRILISVGRQPNSQGIGLENTGVQLDEKGFVQTDPQQKTADASIYAIGDVAGGAMLAHKASAQARVAVEAIAGGKDGFSHKAIPAVVFTDPEIAWAGLSETEAQSQGKEIKTAKFPWGASGRAQTLGRSDGWTKLILDPKTEVILGVGIVGPGAGELIGEGVLAIEMGARAQDLASSIHPHPTLSETLMEAAEAFYGKSIHIYQKP